MPLTRQTMRALRHWLREREGTPQNVVFPSRRGRPLSRHAVEKLVRKHSARAAQGCPSLTNKRISPHVLRHTAAVQLLQAGVDRALIALWLGHESIETTQMYLDADLAIKEAALAKLAPLNSRVPRFRADDQLLAFLRSL